jgi:hypothetical protein
MRKVVACLSVIWTCGFAAPLASADPVRITGGAFVIDHEGDFYFLTGEPFSITHQPFITGLVIPKILTAPSCFVPFQDEQCRTGETLNVSFTTGGDVPLGTGSATIGDTTHSDVTFRGTLDFATAPFVFGTAEPGAFVPVVTPFTFSGLFRGFDGGEELFAVPVSGRGESGCRSTSTQSLVSSTRRTAGRTSSSLRCRSHRRGCSLRQGRLRSRGAGGCSGCSGGDAEDHRHSDYSGFHPLRPGDHAGV